MAVPYMRTLGEYLLRMDVLEAYWCIISFKHRILDSRLFVSNINSVSNKHDMKSVFKAV